MWGITMHLPENIIYDELSNMVDHDECMYSISQKRNLHHMMWGVWLKTAFCPKTQKIKGRNSAGKGRNLPDPFFHMMYMRKRNNQYIR